MDILEAEELYYTLKRIYNSHFLDNDSEFSRSISTLYEAMIEGYKKEYIIAKMKILAMNTGEYKQKLSTIICGKFWI